MITIIRVSIGALHWQFSLSSIFFFIIFLFNFVDFIPLKFLVIIYLIF